MNLKLNRKGTINIDMTPEIENDIQECEEQGRLYGVFPIKGDSMTCDDIQKSIPNGSKVFAIETDFRPNEYLNDNFYKILTKKPVLIIGKDNNGDLFAICKTISVVNCINGTLLLKSYNPFHKDVWIPVKFIQKIFEVKQILNQTL